MEPGISSKSNADDHFLRANFYRSRKKLNEEARGGGWWVKRMKVFATIFPADGSARLKKTTWGVSELCISSTAGHTQTCPSKIRPPHNPPPSIFLTFHPSIHGNEYQGGGGIIYLLAWRGPAKLCSPYSFARKRMMMTWHVGWLVRWTYS